MTDTEIVRACGEAMGWHWDICVPSEVGEFRHYAYAWTGDDGLFVAPPDWDPLISDADCMQVLYHCAHKSIDVDLYNYAHVRKWGVSFSLSADETMLEYNDQNIEAQFRRAVCIAFLKAMGWWEEL